MNALRQWARRRYTMIQRAMSRGAFFGADCSMPVLMRYCFHPDSQLARLAIAFRHVVSRLIGTD
jgi:hypothetical protein